MYFFLNNKKNYNARQRNIPNITSIHRRIYYRILSSDFLQPISTRTGLFHPRGILLCKCTKRSAGNPQLTPKELLKHQLSQHSLWKTTNLRTSRINTWIVLIESRRLVPSVCQVFSWQNVVPTLYVWPAWLDQTNRFLRSSDGQSGPMPQFAKNWKSE